MRSKPTILEEIFRQKKARVEKAKLAFDYEEFVSRAEKLRYKKRRARFRNAFSDKSKINIVAEIKRASPSKGIIKKDVDVAAVVRAYEKCGAAAISVLTEEDHFKGNVEDLLTARNLTDLAILRKDFVFDEFQVYESVLIYADAILLIVAMLEDSDLERLYSLASDLGLDVLVETHDLNELERAGKLGAKMIGVNNRNLHTFEVSLETSRTLMKHAPDNSIMICESGLSTNEDLIEMRDLGFNGFLIGESLIKSHDLKEKFGELTTN